MTFLHSFDEELAPLVSKQQLKSVKTRVYKLSKVKKSKKWLKNILLDKSDDEEEEEDEDEDQLVKEMLRFHRLEKKARKQFHSDPQLKQYHNYSASLISGPSLGPTSPLIKTVVKKSKPPKKPKPVTAKPVTIEPTPVTVVTTTCADTMTTTSISDLLPTIEKALKKAEKCLEEISETIPAKDSPPCPAEVPPRVSSFAESTASSSYHIPTTVLPDEIFDTEESSGSVLSQTLSQPTPTHPMTTFPLPKCATAPTTPTSLSPSTSPVMPAKRAKRVKKRLSGHSSVVDSEALLNAKRKRLWIMIARKEIPRAHRQKAVAKKEALANLKRMANWCQREKRKRTIHHQKHFCRDQLSRAKRLTREMLMYWKRFDKAEKDIRKRAEKEAQEQLKVDMELLEAKRQQRKLNFLITQTELYAHFLSKKVSVQKEEQEILKSLEETPLTLQSGVEDDYDPEVDKQEVIGNVKSAVEAHHKHQNGFGSEQKDVLTEEELSEPKMFDGVLKPYQKKGMNWLHSLYERAINGILADEMGLGKTIQTIAFLATLAERHGIWGPFLVVAPASTLHNWQQEFARFVPNFKVLPYWGNPQDRRVLRHFWSRSSGSLVGENASFHVLLTSYQLAVRDAKYFQRIKWMYMVLDEAQAIKSSASARWKTLLAFECRNRLLLTGTPVQNSMAELWSLLHFIMPQMFDSHEEFDQWFSKDIETSVAEKRNAISERHLSRLHMILTPFVLRRVKKDVEDELSDKIEIKLSCRLTARQQMMYSAIKNKISVDDLLTTTSSSSLMNIVMQLRKVCNHPDLIERRQASSPFLMTPEEYFLPRLIFESGLCGDLFELDPIRHRLLNRLLNIFTSDYIQESVKSEDSCFSYLPFVGYSADETNRLFFSDFISTWTLLEHEMRLRTRILHEVTWSQQRTAPFIVPLKTTLLNESRDASQLLFTSPVNDFIYAHLEHRVHRSTPDVESSPRSDQIVPSSSKSRLPESRNCCPTSVPRFLDITINKTNGLKAIASPKTIFCRNSRAEQRSLVRLGSSPLVKRLILIGDLSEELKTQFSHVSPKGLSRLKPLSGWSPIVLPDRGTLVSDSGKLRTLDTLLTELKSGGHRVLIYSQMTRMIDLLEEFVCARKYTYMRLDGRSKMADRRDMVSDFQTRTDIFVFLLSTRAGGLGINLTAADTVVFYDSDWNPTVDQQAMDRAHRLGQTKQVTVYRLVTEDTVEERIVERARHKAEIQRMVISGRVLRPETLKTTEVVSLLLDDEELEKRFRERRADDGVTWGRKRRTKDIDKNKVSIGLDIGS